jgi:abhydrolase domain-containing protein 6
MLRTNGEVAERLKAHAWKVCIQVKLYRGFESLSLRQTCLRMAMNVFRLFLGLFLFCTSLLQLHATPPPVYIANTPHGHVSYYRIGQGTPVVLLHGLFANKAQWLTLVNHLQAHQAAYQFIIPDLPGFGESNDFPITIYNLTSKDNPSLNQVQALHEFLTTIKLPTPFALAGNSLGGLIAEQYTETYPTDVSTLSFIGSTAGVTPFTNEFYQQIAQGYNPFIPLTTSQLMEEIKLLMVNVKAHLPAPELMNQLLQKNKKNYQKLATIYMMVSSYHHLRMLMDPLPNIKIPVLIFWGTEDHIFGDINHAYFLKSRFVKSPLRHVIPLEQAGHVVMLENDQVLEKITVHYLDFLKTAHEKMNVEFA